MKVTGLMQKRRVSLCSIWMPMIFLSSDKIEARHIFPEDNTERAESAPDQKNGWHRDFPSKIEPGRAVPRTLQSQLSEKPRFHHGW